MLKVQLVDGSGTGNAATISEKGQLIVSPVSANSVKFVEMTVNDIGYTLVPPSIDGKDILLSGLFITADSSVTGQAIVNVYLANASGSATIDTSIFQLEILKQNTIILSDLNIRLDKGFWLNSKTDDNNIQITALYYYL
jgi:hypothetical protein